MLGVESLLGNYLFVGDADAGDSLEFQLTGLAENTSYELHLYGVGDAAGQGATWTVGTESLITA